jgi:hypothetical protein
MHARIVWYVDRELEKKGLKKSKDGPGDLLVRYYAKKQEGLKGTPTQEQTTLPGGAGQLTTGVDFQKVLEGTLLIELQRSRDNGPVWRAATEYKSIDKQKIARRHGLRGEAADQQVPASEVAGGSGTPAGGSGGAQTPRKPVQICPLALRPPSWSRSLSWSGSVPPGSGGSRSRRCDRGRGRCLRGVRDPTTHPLA